MTTMNIQDIRHKKQVNTKYKPNTYRIFCEDIDNSSIPDESKYSSQAPPIYTQPAIIPAQAVEDRNFPHAGRAAGFLRENAFTYNEPVNRISAKNVNKEMEKRWWEWNLPENDVNWKSKRRSNSSAPRADATNESNKSEFQTTYQKDHGYMNGFGPSDGRGESAFSQKRHYNPNTSHAVGIVPVNDLNSYTNSNEPQRLFVDKMSFEHDYDSRNPNNYATRGKRQGAFVVEQLEPRRPTGSRSRPDSNKGASMWDVMHPSDEPIGQPDQNTLIYKKPPSGISDEQRRQRRDPIGYFDDTRFGGSIGQNMPNTNPAANFNSNINANTREPIGNYNPSWSNPNYPEPVGNQPSNDLFETTLNYQKPISVGYQN